jgi:alkane 1-monooxygenase
MQTVTETESIQKQPISSEKDKEATVNIDKFPVAPYYLVYMLHLLTLLSWVFGGAAYYLPVIFTFGLIPVLDLVRGVDDVNPTKEQEKVMDKMWKYRLPTLIWVPAQYITLIFCTWIATHQNLTLSEYIGLVTGMGIHAGLGINVAHELTHKYTKLERLAGKASLAATCYLHFYIEHPVGHHWHVATPKDPATSRLGESFYQFWPRTVIYSFISAIKLEEQRLTKQNKPTHILFNFENLIFWCFLGPILIIAGLTFMFGNLFQVTAFFLIQSFFGFSLLELVNYIEHYGLVRKEVKPGIYEPVNPLHSWNAPFRVTNYFLFKLQRHSDHHAYPIRRYQILRSFEESPQMPTGYAGMILMAVVPPLWFKVMDPLVKEFNSQTTDKHVLHTNDAARFNQ